MKGKSKVKAFLEVSRAKLLIGSLGLPLAGLLAGVKDASSFLSLDSLIYVLLHYSIIIPACHLNCLYDYEVDRKYKTYMSEGVDTLGKKFLKTIIPIEFAIALIIIIYFYATGRFLTAICGILGVFFAASYSAEPLRIKKRGFWSPFPVIIGMYTLSPLGGWFVFNENVELPFLVFLIGYALMSEGFTFVNTCEDFSEDAESGIKTWAHVFGIKRTLQVASVFSFAGLGSIAYLAFRIYMNFDGLKDVLDIFLLVVSCTLVTKSAIEVDQVWRGDDLERKSKQHGKKLAKWFISTRYPIVFTLIAILV